jgi:iron complex outermembrane receptor protein
LREDGSTTFAPGEHAYFPSLGLAYRFKKDLLANVDWISDIKLRAGYGVTGNSIDQYGNPTPKWQEIHGSDVGLDFSLLNGRLSGDLNYFNNETSKALVLVSLPSPPFTGGILPANIGSLTNKGLEISLSGRIISGNKLNWTAYGQITL